ncbi:MAG: NDP-sugar synthase [Candidatus Buchananbacteria bacterium]
MKAIILAGGEGTRLRPLTYEIPKALIPVQGKTLTEQVFDIYKNVKVTEIILSISYLADKMVAYFEDGNKFGFDISYLREDRPRGTAGPLLLLKEKNEIPSQDFFMSNGDNLFALDLKKMIEFHKNQKAVVTIALVEAPDPTQVGVVKMSGDKILEFVEKPTREKAPSSFANSGYYIISPEIFNYLPNQEFVMLEKDVFPVLAKAGKLFGFIGSGQWFDTGTPERYLQVQKEWRGPIKIEK